MSQALYQRIAAALRQRILSGGHPAGDLLPSENELAGAYHTSRVTVRKAFNLLEAEGLIKARQGKGYIVQPPRHSEYTLFFGSGEELGHYRCEEVRLLPPDPDVSRALNLHNGQLTVVIRRVLERSGVSIACDEKYIPYERGSPTVERELNAARQPEERTDRTEEVSLRTEMTLRVAVPPPEVRKALGCGKEGLLMTERLFLALGGKRLGLSRTYLTPDYGPLMAYAGLPVTEDSEGEKKNESE